MFGCTVNAETELQLVSPADSEALFDLFTANHAYLRRWHPWVAGMNSLGDVGKVIDAWRQLYDRHQAVFASIRFQGRCCGMINLHKIDWPNRWAALSYWLAASHQGRGIMTQSSRTLIAHCFNNWQLNRVTIECATDNLRSRAIAQRLGFREEGLVREIEWLEDRFADHVMYGLLRGDCAEGYPTVSSPSVQSRRQQPQLVHGGAAR